MTIFTRKRLVTAGCVLGFVAVLAGIGAVSKSTPSDAAPGSISTGSATEKLPTLPWYWTMIVSPNDENVLVLGSSKGIYRSGDGGKTWKAVGPKGVHATSIVQLGDSMIMGGVNLGPNASPNPIIRKGGARAAPDGPAAVAESTDDGKTWTDLKPTGLPKVTIQALAVDPKDENTLYALLNDGKLFRSTDKARSFQLVTPKLGIAPWAIAVTLDGRFVSGDMDSGSFVSANAKKWQNTPFKDSNGGKMVMEYAIHPSDAKRILMSSDGIMMSSDGGKTWRIVLNSKTVMFGPIAYVPSSSDVAYAIGFNASFWRSDDGGKTWKQVS
jgi:photosystem II stability/assembly factor-like uncharacterized protein